VFAGLVGMIVTMLNLVPAGMFDGGHITRSILGEKWHRFASYAGVALLALAGWWPMAMLALLFASAKHPGPLDDVSELTAGRKVGAVVLLAVFVLSFSISGVAI
jgi:membrane-associated protease RseP (regulator of RpoE activity)